MSDGDTRFCPKCGHRLMTRGGHFSQRGHYTRYKVCSNPKCGQTPRTRERFSQDIESPTPAPA